MLRKPMLLQKLQMIKNRTGRIVIGLIGSHHGVGVTHTGLMLSFYLSEEVGLNTAFLECNKHYDLQLIEEAYEWQQGEGGTFSFRNLTCHKGVTPSQVPRIFGEDYEGMVLDFGTDLAANQEEFLRCGIKIVVGGSSEWDIRKLEKFTKETEQIKGNESWFYLIPQGNEKALTKIRAILGKKVWSVPSVSDPVLPTNSSNRFFRSIFNL
jgi:hypothetical protein